ncbi:MAG: putative membrane protein [Promethearchaeota archaeon]|nr:MAG: putative membrane protein [Candidatus Lokiarchaeota archaeon]
MSENKSFFEGKIAPVWKKKEIFKLLIGETVIFGLIFTIFTIVLIFTPLPFMIYLFMVLFIVILPYFVIFIPGAWYTIAYFNNFAYKITEDNIIIFHGVFNKIRATIPYSRVQNINVVNGVFDRIFNTYTVKIETAGSSAAAASAQSGFPRPEGYIPGLKDPNLVEEKINEMLQKYSSVPSGLEDKIFKPEEVAFDNFIGYILSKMREGERLKTSIKELREKAGLSISELAQKVDTPSSTIKYLEQGRYNPSLTLAYRLSEALDCKIEELFEHKK